MLNAGINTKTKEFRHGVYDKKTGIHQGIHYLFIFYLFTYLNFQRDESQLNEK